MGSHDGKLRRLRDLPRGPTDLDPTPTLRQEMDPDQMRYEVPDINGL